MAADLGITLPLVLRTDATAAMGMARRLGIGNIRHLDTALLWVQHQIRSGEVLLEKVPGAENPGDTITKYLSGPELNAHLGRMGLELEEGRPETAPQLTTQVVQQMQAGKQVIDKEKKAWQ